MCKLHCNTYSRCLLGCVQSTLHDVVTLPTELCAVVGAGHPRLQGLLEHHVASARALIFVVDGRDSCFLAGSRATAECVPRCRRATRLPTKPTLLLLHANAVAAPRAFCGHCVLIGRRACRLRQVLRWHEVGAGVKFALAWVGRLLYEALSHAVVARRRLPLLLAVNKADQGAACHSVEFVRKRLEKEMCANAGPPPHTHPHFPAPPTIRLALPFLPRASLLCGFRFPEHLTCTLVFRMHSYALCTRMPCTRAEPAPYDNSPMVCELAADLMDGGCACLGRSEVLRGTRGTLADASGGGGRDAVLGLEGVPFAFSQLPNKVRERARAFESVRERATPNLPRSSSTCEV